MDTVKEVTEEAISNIKDGMENVADIQGASQDGVQFKGRSGKMYLIRPCGLDVIPKLLEQVKIVDTAIQKGGATTDLLTANKNEVLMAMGRIVAIGLDVDLEDEVAVKKVMSEFSLGKFPEVYKTVLDLNDFLAEMRTLYQ